MCKVISVINEKGGVAKTTTAKTIKLESGILEKYFNNESKEEIISIVERSLEECYLNKSL